METEDYCLKDYWEYFKKLNSQNNILGTGCFEDALEQFIKELKDILTMDGFGHHTDKSLDKIIKRDIISTIDRLSGFALHEDHLNVDDEVEKWRYN